MSDFEAFLSSLTDEQKQKLLDALSSDSKKQASNTAKPSTKSVVVDDNFMVKKTDDNNNRRKEPVRARRNDWVDEGEFRDIETPKVERTPRNRQQSKKVDVDCSVCGRSFKEDPKFIYGEYHRCSRCTGR
jgi:hypothetical protein